MRTNKASNTAFRGFGAPQAMIAPESIIEKVAAHLGKTPEHIRELNMITKTENHKDPKKPKENPRAPWGQEISDCVIKELWTDLKDKCAMDKTLKEIKQFNEENAYVKRGFSMIPTV